MQASNSPERLQPTVVALIFELKRRRSSRRRFNSIFQVSVVATSLFKIFQVSGRRDVAFQDLKRRRASRRRFSRFKATSVVATSLFKIFQVSGVASSLFMFFQVRDENFHIFPHNFHQKRPKTSLSLKKHPKSYIFWWIAEVGGPN